jgi:hypothetical protein
MNDAGVRRTVRTKGCRGMPDKCDSRIGGVDVVRRISTLRGRRGGRDRAAPGSASLPPAARAGCAALHIPRPCAFHALKTSHNRLRRGQDPRSSGRPTCSAEADPRAGLFGRSVIMPSPVCRQERASILTTGADDKRARSQCKGTRPSARVPSGRPLHCPLIRTFLDSLL